MKTVFVRRARAPVSLYQQFLLLCLHDKQGHLHRHGCRSFLPGVMIAQLILAGRVRLVRMKTKCNLQIIDDSPAGDPVIDQVMSLIAEAPKPRDLTHWLQKLAPLAKLDRLADPLLKKNVLRKQETRWWGLVPRSRYPEVKPSVERQVRRRMAKLMFGQSASHDPATTLLIAFARLAGLLKFNFDPSRLARNKVRIEKIASGDLYRARASKSESTRFDDALNVVTTIQTLAQGGG